MEYINTNTYIVIGIIAIITYAYILYVGLIKKRNKMLEALSSIDVQLKKRYDLIPNIIAIAKGFMDHEKYLMTEVTKLRTQVMNISSDFKNMNKKIEMDKELASKMRQFLICVENYPNLKSDKTMILAMQTYNEVEEHIAAARRFYNSAVNELRNAVEIFPSSMIAKMIGVKSRDFFSAKEEDRQNVNIYKNLQ